jgi:UTP--glucose-1-phosphate uridylyltransferase
LGHAVLCAKHLVGDEPFAVILADDLIDTGEGVAPVMKQMVMQYDKLQSSVLGCVNVERHETSSYGIVASKPISTKPGERVSKMSAIVEKPKPENAPSTLSVVGRYILTPQIFAHLEMIQAGVGKEIQLTDGIAALLKNESVYAYDFEGTRYDCGSKLGYLKATVELGKKHPEVGKAFAEFLANGKTKKKKP